MGKNEQKNARAAGEPLKAKELDQVVGGMDVQIDQVHTTVSTDDGSSSGTFLKAVVTSVLSMLRRPW
jgi:hypothetical protein